MELISPLITKRGASPCTSQGKRRSGFNVYSPSSAGSSAFSSSSRQAGWVKSPVATSAMPLRRAHKSRWGKSRSRLVAREYLEWMCKSAIYINQSPVLSAFVLRQWQYYTPQAQGMQSRFFIFLSASAQSPLVEFRVAQYIAAQERDQHSERHIDRRQQEKSRKLRPDDRGQHARHCARHGQHDHR